MSEILAKNAEYASVLKDVIKLRHEPVAIKLIKEDEEYPEGYEEPVRQMSHCQTVFAAKNGESYKMPLASQGCMVGASALGMADPSEKISSGEFHANIGMHDSIEAAGNMIGARMVVPYKTKGEVVCPLKDADFEPDVVALVDIPERIYWIVPLTTAEKGGRLEFSTSPFQCACEDVTVVPICKGTPNISIGCFGCRKRTDMQADEMACGIPYSLIPGYVEHLKKYEQGVMLKANRE